MSKAFQKLVLGCGLMSLAHAAYSAAQRKFGSSFALKLHFHSFLNLLIKFSDRTYLRITEQEFTTLPLDVSSALKQISTATYNNP